MQGFGRLLRSRVAAATHSILLAAVGVVCASPAWSDRILKTEKYGNWTAASVEAAQPSILVTLPAINSPNAFVVQCLTNAKRWLIMFMSNGANFPSSSKFHLALTEPGGTTHTVELKYFDKSSVYAFFDRDKDVFQAVRWFTIFPSLTASLKADFPADPIRVTFDTTGASEATRIPIAACAAPKP